MTETVIQQHSHDSLQDPGGIMPEGAREYGFSVTELNPELRTTREVDDVFADSNEITQRATELVHDGIVTFEEPDSKKVMPNVFPVVEFSKAELRPFGLTLVDRLPDAALKDEAFAAVLHEKEKAALEKAAAAYTERFMDRDYLQFDSRFVAGIDTVSQAFEVDNGREGSFRIFNFANTSLEGNKLHKLINAVREMDQRTGGSSTEAVWTVGIFPETSEFWKYTDQNGEELQDVVVHARASGGGVISINETLIAKDPKERGALDEQYSVSDGDIETTMFHELTHVVESPLLSGPKLPSESFGWELQRDESGYLTNDTPIFMGTTENPSEYGRVNHREDVAESAAAIFNGGEWAKALDDPRRIAIEGLFAARHNGNIGPAYLRVKELSLGSIGPAEKFGLHLTKPVVVRPSFSYQVTN